MTETDIRIARAVALKAAVDLVNGNAILLADLEGKAEDLAGWLLSGAETPASPPPHTEAPPDVPYGEEEYGESLRHCIDCGSALEHKSGVSKAGKDYDGFFCPNSDKSEPNKHKPVWA